MNFRGSFRSSGSRRIALALLSVTTVVLGGMSSAPAAPNVPRLAVGLRCGDVGGLIKALTNPVVTIDLNVDNVPSCTYVLTAPYRGSIRGLPIVHGSATIHGHGSTILRNSAIPFAMFVNNGNTTLDHLTISGGHCDQQCIVGGIYNDARLSLTDVTVRGNSGPTGGIWNVGLVTLTRVILAGNRGDYGGGISNLGNVTVRNSIVSGNSADSGAGIFNGTTGVLTLLDSSVVGNSAEGTGQFDGGGGVFNDAGGVMTIVETLFDRNETAAAGGGIMNFGTVALIMSSLSGNAASGVGGGLADEGNLSCAPCGPALATMYGGSARDNRASTGGAIFSKFTAAVITHGVAFSGNAPNNCAPSGRVVGCSG